MARIRRPGQSTDSLHPFLAALQQGLQVLGETSAETPLRLGVAVSGGRDSVALFHGLTQFKAYQPVALIVDHGIQASSKQWADWTVNWCHSQNLEALVTRFDPGEIQKQSQTLGLEAAARRARQRALAEMAKQAGLKVVALAHHQDDQIETVLLQILRTGSLASSAAMPMAFGEDPAWIRPLLHVPRALIDDYVASEALQFVEDPSNRDLSISRNALRHHVLPLMERSFIQAGRSLLRLQAELSELLPLVERQAQEDLIQVAKGRPTLDCSALGQLSEFRRLRVMKHWLRSMQKDSSAGIPIRDAALIRFILQALTAKPDRQPMLKIGQGSLKGHTLYRFRSEIHCVPPRMQQQFEFEFVEQGPGIRCHDTSTPRFIPRAQLGRLARVDQSFKPSLDRPARPLKLHFQAAAIAPWERDQRLVLLIDQHIAWVEGFGADVRQVVYEGRRGEVKPAKATSQCAG